MRAWFSRSAMPVVVTVVLVSLLLTAIPGTAIAASAGPAVSAQVYFTAGGGLVAETRQVDAGAPAQSALEQLQTAPQAGHFSEIPQTNVLQSISVMDGVAYVSFSPQFFAPDGALGMQLRLAEVVFTLTQFPTIDAVQFLQNGQFKEVAAGDGFPIGRPLARRDFAHLAPG
jgi:spore germination protein GerM